MAGLLVSIGLIQVARAQSNGTVILSGISAKNFPVVEAALQIYDSNNEFIPNLQADDILMHEGDQSTIPFRFEYNRPGAQFVIAMSLGPAMGVRDGEGNSRFDFLKAELLKQAGYFSADNPDDFSVVIAGGPELIHSASVQAWADLLANYQPDNLRTAEPDLQILGRALEIAADQTPRSGMGRAVLYITPPQPLSASPGLLNLAATARQRGIRVYVWLVASPADALTVNSESLKSLASETGGKFLNFDLPNDYPLLTDDLEASRSLYTLAYTSTLRTNGIYTVSAEVNVNGIILLGSPEPLQVDLQMPNPIFVGLPVRIERWTSPITTTAAMTANAAYIYYPDTQAVEIFIEFPDGHKRSLVKSTLLVDGVPVAVNESAPFNQFEWDISAITTNSKFILQAEVVDTLGLTGASAEMPVDVHVDIPQSNKVLDQIPWQIIAAAGLGLLVIAAVLLLVLLLTGRLQPGLLGQGRRWQRTNRRPPDATIPLSQAQVKMPAPKKSAATRRLPGWIHRPQRTPAETTTQPLAYLAPLDEGSEQNSPIPILGLETTFGRDSTAANWTIDDPSLEGLHARLRREGSFYRLLDENSVAGTWINFCAVPPGGARLFHGDVVHFGKIGFRFTLRDTRQPRKPTVTLFTGYSRSGKHESN